MKYLIIILSIAGFFSCSGKKGTELFSINEEKKYVLSDVVVEKLHIVTSKPQIIDKSETIFISGTKVTIADDYTLIAPSVSGFISELNVNKGDMVHKGQLLAIFNHPDYLEMKIQFIEARNNFEFYKKNFARQGELAIEQATSIKKMESAEILYKQAEIKFYGLREKLKSIGVNAEKLSIKNLNDLGYLYSTAEGFVSEINGFKGQYCTNASVVFRIISGYRDFFQFKLDGKTGNSLHSKDSLRILPGFENQVYLPVFSMEQDESGWTILVKDNYEKKSGLLPQIMAEFICVKQFYKLPEEALIPGDWIFVFQNQRVVKIKKVECHYKEQDYVYLNYFPLSENEEFIIGNPDLMLKEITNYN